MTESRVATPGDDLAGYLVRYPYEITFGVEDPGVVFDRYHSDVLVLSKDGVDLERDRLLAHVRAAHRRVEEVHVEVHQTLTAKPGVAARYTLTAVMRGGRVIATEIHMFGELAADGRLRRMSQLSRDVSPKPGG